ncbi:MAG: radical SAM protein [Bacillota bacterium]
MRENFGEYNNQNVEREKKMPKLKGVDFELETVKEAIKKDRPLQISVAFPRQKCNLNCLYCYTSEFEKNDKRKKEDDLMNLLDNAKKMGVDNLLLPGYGEPFLNREIWPLLDKARDLGIYTTIFTNGSSLDDQQIEALKDYPVTLVVKCNSFNKEKEDKVSGKKEYAKKRNRTLDKLISEGFNIPDKDGNVRLAVASMIYKNNVDDVIEIIEWAARNNVVPMISGTSLSGNAEKHTDILGESQELNDAFSQVSKKIEEKSPNLYKQIFTPRAGNIVSQTSSLLLEYPSGKLVSDLFRSKEVDEINFNNLEDAWSKDKEGRTNRIQANHLKIQDLENLDNVYGNRINAEALENKRNEYIAFSVDYVFKSYKSEIKKMIRNLEKENIYEKKNAIKKLFSVIATYVEGDILTKHKFDKKNGDENIKQKILNEYPKIKIDEFIDYRLKQYMGEESYNKLMEQLEQPDVKLFKKSEYLTINQNDELIKTGLWSKADWKYNRLYLPENENVAMSFIAAARSLGHFTAKGKIMPIPKDFDSLLSEEKRAWENGWEYLKKIFFVVF